MGFTLPGEFAEVVGAFSTLFTRPTWVRVQALLCGALLCATGTVTAALRALGMGRDPGFQNFHRVLNRARWSALKAVHILLKLLTDAFTRPGEPLIFGLDDTVERRRGTKIKARAIYHDAVRSSKSCPQKTSGLRWLSLHLLVPVQWAKRIWALPVLTAICPSERYAPFVAAGRKHKPMPRRARGLIAVVWRWLGNTGRHLIFVADSSYSTLELLGWCSRLASRCAVRSVSFITRLRLDAALYEVATPRQAGQAGRTRVKGVRLPSLKERLEDATTCWTRVEVSWYGPAGFTPRTVELTSGTCVWYHQGMAPVPIRWVLVRDPAGKFRTQALLSTHLAHSPKEIVEYFVRRWQMEVTFEETNAHLGLPGQRQWSDLSIQRSTPIRLGLFSLVSLLADAQQRCGKPIPVRCSAWYTKVAPTFSDALVAVRRTIWTQIGYSMSKIQPDLPQTSQSFFAHLTEVACYAG